MASAEYEIYYSTHAHIIEAALGRKVEGNLRSVPVAELERAAEGLRAALGLVQGQIGAPISRFTKPASLLNTNFGDDPHRVSGEKSPQFEITG